MEKIQPEKFTNVEKGSKDNEKHLSEFNCHFPSFMLQFLHNMQIEMLTQLRPCLFPI